MGLEVEGLEFAGFRSRRLLHLAATLWANKAVCIHSNPGNPASPPPNAKLDPATQQTCRYSAATPATWGVAIEVPLMVASEVSSWYEAETMEEPGAKMERQAPMLE